MTEMKPLPCPFCGSEPTGGFEIDGFLTIECRKCLPSPSMSVWVDEDGPASIFEAWNTRAPIGQPTSADTATG